MSRPTSFFRPYSPQGTGGVFAESSDQIHQQPQYGGYGGGPQGTGGIFSEDHSSHHSDQPIAPGPNKRRPRPIPVWAKRCGIAAIIVAIIIAIILGAVLGTRAHNNRGNVAPVISPNPSNTPSSSPASLSNTLPSTSAPPTASTTNPSTSATASATNPSASVPASATNPSASVPASATGVPATGATGATAGASASGVPASGAASAGASATGAGASGAGSATGVGATGAASATGPGATGYGATGAGATGYGATGVGATGYGATGYGATGVGATGAASATPAYATGVVGPGGRDSFQPANPQPTIMRPDRPRLIAPAYQFAALPAAIASNSYLQTFDNAIMSNANQIATSSPVSPSANATGPYDVSREVKMNIKTLAYAYRMTSSQEFLTRVWAEIQNILSYAHVPSEPLSSPYAYQLPYSIDVYDLASALAIAYDWLFESWTAAQRKQIEALIIWLALASGIRDFGLDSSAPAAWTTALGQENCISNAGISMGLVAIWDSFSSTWAGDAGAAQQVLTQSLQSATNYCANSVSQDGTFVETPSAMLAGTTAHAELAASLLSATGGTYGLINPNSNFAHVGLSHIYATGPQGLFNYGDAETNTYSVTGNSLMFYATQYATPAYMLFQKDSPDAAADPWSMFWYNPSFSGELWKELPLDHFFDAPQDSWASMRSSWTDNHGLYVAMKGGQLTGHSAEGDLDVGDFVIDALGERWAVELGSAMVNATGYSASEAQDSQRWLYYRKRTEGQNTILINGQNQNVDAAPTSKFGSSNTVQSSDAPFAIPEGSTAFFTIDMSSAYGQGDSVKRGIRLLNGRRQVLLQDDISCSQGIEWRMHTTASVQVNGAVAYLTQNGQTMEVQIINPPNGACFKTEDAVRLSSDPSLPPGTIDPPNSGVTVLSIVLPAGSYNLQVLFTPQWSDLSADHYVTPPFVAIDGWTLTSHG
ncbi:hypothetical protein FRC04_006150 [Tulasnella sp. 424]|nr:hypothetical protein FRC04_006150 [Tulasnella sp. 424]KAG8973008.1 hypothetical protein FRC05_009424 [Tulasnella sp. 425]